MNHAAQQFARDDRGSITLMTVFLTGLIAFLLVFTDNARAMRQVLAATVDAASEQAFYSSQSCLEEGYLQLRFHEAYESPYSEADPLVAGNLRCTLRIQDGATPRDGLLISDGVSGRTKRTVASSYRDAGPSTTRNKTAIFNILDRSGSMADDGIGCSDGISATQAVCTAAGSLWGPRPFVFVKTASLAFLDRLEPAFDQTGLISYNESVTLNANLTTNYDAVRPIIRGLTQGGYTNIGDAIRIATQQLASVTGRSKVAILLTDGVPNRPEPASTATDYALHQANLAKGQGVLVITIGLGDGVNTTLLENMASSVGGRLMYYPAPNASDLDGIYSDIADVLTAYNIGQGSWSEE